MELVTNFKIKNKKKMKKYIEYIDGEKITFKVADNFPVIRNSEGINVDSVEVYKGFGIIMKLKGNIIRIIKGLNINIEFNDWFNTVSILYDGTEKDYFNKKTLYLYYKNDITNKDCDDYNDVIFTNKYKVDDIVYTQNIEWLIKDKNSLDDKRSISSLISLNILNTVMENKEKTEEELRKLIDEAINIKMYVMPIYELLKFKVIGTEGKLYKISAVHPEVYEQIIEEDRDIFVFLKETYYATEKDLTTLSEMIENTFSFLENWKNR